jgi:DHA2 family multidrug resistance protein
MLAVGIGALQILLDKGQEDDWFGSQFILALAVIAGIALVAFIVWELVTRNPVVHLRVFKERTYTMGVSLMTTLGFVLYGSMVALPIMLQTLLGYPALEAGIAMAPRGLGSFIAMPAVGAVMSKVDPRKLLAGGLFIASITLIQLGRLNQNAGYWDFFWPQFFQGIGMALTFVPLTTITMDPIPKPEMGNATSIFNLMRNIGGSVGIATATTMIARQSQRDINILGAHVSQYNPQAQALFQQLRAALIARGADPATATRQAYGALFGMVMKQSSVLSFMHTFLFFGFVFLVLLPLLLLMRRPAHARGGMPVH